MVDSLSGLILLKIADTEPPLYLVVEYPFYPDYDYELWDHLFESKMCPRDVVGVAAVLTYGDADPHGVFEFVQAVEKPVDWPFVGVVDWARYRRLFTALPSLDN